MIRGAECICSFFLRPGNLKRNHSDLSMPDQLRQNIYEHQHDCLLAEGSVFKEE